MTTSVERINLIERASELHLKRYKYSEIARELDITPAYAKALVDDYKQLVRERAQSDPDVLDRLLENTLEMLDSVEIIEKEIWETYQKAKDFEMISQQNATLKNAMDIAEKRAKLLQLMGARADSGSTARLQKAERVNQIVSGVIKEIVSQCPRCRQEAQVKLAEAFQMMNDEEGVVEMEEIPGDIVEAEVVDDAQAELDRVDMMRDVLSDE